MIAEWLNSSFVNITDSLDLDPTFKYDTVCLDMEFKIDSAILKYKEHSSTINIRNKAACASTFQFEHVDSWEVISQIEALDPNKSNSGEIPTNIIHITKDIMCSPLTDFINAAFKDCCFPGNLKETDVTPIFQNGDSCRKVNHRPINFTIARKSGNIL